MPPKPRQPSTTTTLHPRLPPPSASPPTALLWAHQLRRENNALLERILALEKSVKDSVGGIEDERRKVVEDREKAERKVEGRLDGLRDEVGELERKLEGLRAWREGVEGRERDRDVVVEGLKREVGELREGMESARKYKRTCRRTVTGSIYGGREESPLVAGTQQRFESLELGDVAPLQQHPATKPEECPVSGQAGDIVIRDSMATQTPSDMAPEIPESQSNDRHLTDTQLHTQQRELSEVTQSTTDLDAISSHLSQSQMNQLPQKSSSLHLVQGSLSLSEYLQLGEDMRAKIPGRREEGRVVEAFWEGMNDCETKNMLEERLEKEGWAWEITREVCGAYGEQKRDIRQGETEKDDLEITCGGYQEEHPALVSNEFGEGQGKESKAVPMEKKRKRKRRFIPVVPIDEDDYFTL